MFQRVVLSRFDFVLSGLLDTVFGILNSSSGFLRLSVYKFYRQVVKTNDLYLINQFIRAGYFAKVFDELFTSLFKENTIFSCLLSIVNEIWTGGNAELMDYVQSTFANRFKGTSVFGYFEKIHKKLASINEIPTIKKTCSFDLLANENFFENIESLKPVKRTESSNSDPSKKLKLI